MKRFLVTGGAGFIGSNLCEKLLEEGFNVRVIDNLATGKEENIKDFIGPVEFIKGDIRDKSTVKKAVKGVDYVIHLAALGSVPRSVQDPETTHEVNSTGTLTVLNAAREEGVRRVVYASSSSVYGDTPALPKKEEMIPTPQSPYAVSKLSGEYYCRVFYRVYGLETVSLRYFNVYGKRQDPASQYAAVIPKFITAVLKDENPTIYGDGEQTRDFTFVDDCNQANIKACFSKNSAGGFFNVGSSRRISINELFHKIKNAAGKDIKPIYLEPRKGDVKHSLADISMAREHLSYEPQDNIDSGLIKTIKWYEEALKV
jgi:nucleoside-diphosphate-sugar epimerase